MPWLGDYSPATSYSVYDEVLFDGTSYVCISPATGVSPTNTDYWKTSAAMGFPVPPWQKDSMSVVTPGETSFELTHTPLDLTSVLLSLNGLTSEIGIDYTCSGTTITWLNANFTLAVGDVLLAYYRR